MEKEPTAGKIIDALGGTSETARIFGIKPPSVTGWRTDGIPASRLMFLRLAHPELFDAQPETSATPIKPTETK